mmetsp:Transcript_63028/g.111981  ORF Transcript_63028/g.111981 Transcript_63028/m.111981 type:complete len:334 (+) Transcript_63028:113-1114(+)
MKRRADREPRESRESRDFKRSRPQQQAIMPCVLKFLTPEALASAVIGKGGAAIADMRSKTQTKISLTEHNEFFQGTDSRILTAQGNTEESLMEVSSMILAKVSETAQDHASDAVGTPGDLKLNVLVPKVAVGGIIGKGGTNVKNLRENSGGKISISEPVGYGQTAEQVVALGGSEEAIKYILEEVNKQVQALGEESWFEGWANSKQLSTGSAAGLPLSSGSGGKGYGGKGSSSGGNLLIEVAQGLPHYVMEDSRGFALSCVIPNRLVGGIIGRGGNGTKEVQQLTGTKIGIREIPGDPDNRSMNIAGPLANACAAYMLMMKRYLDSEAQASRE